MGCGPSKDIPVVDASKPQGAPAPSSKKAEEEKKRLERIGISAEPLPDFTPSPCFVIKTKRTNTHQKAFINVFHHDSVPTTSRYVTRNEQWKVDRKGDQVCVFTCVIPSSEYARILKNPVAQSELCTKVISLMNDLYPVAMLDLDYILPKIHAGFIGEGIDLISSDPNAPKYALAPVVVPPSERVAPVAPAADPVVKKVEALAAKPAAAVTAPALVNPHLTLQKSQAAEKEQLVHAPPKMQGWLKKKGHIVINWKTRYFVLDSGYLTYYVDQLDEPPYGKDRKGQICLAGYRTVHSGTHGTNTMGEDNGSPEFQCRIQLLLMNNTFQERSGRTADYNEVMVEAATQEEKHAWLAALSAHIHYVESSLTIAAQVEQKVNNGEVASSSGGRTVSTVSTAGAVAGGGAGVVVVSDKSEGNLGAESVTTTLTATNDPKQWMVYVDALHHESIVLCGQVNKPNPMGKVMIRELILTSRKRLMYVDTKTLEQKGEIDWNKATVEPFVKLINATTFEVHHGDENKVYKFITKDELTAQHWADAINSIKPAVRA